MPYKLPSLGDIKEDTGKNPHLRLISATVEKLRAKGYRILSCEGCKLVGIKVDVGEDDLRYRIAPDYGFSYGDMARHDIVADKEEELVFVEASTSNRIGKQIAEAKRKGKVIIVFPIRDTNNEVWSLKELDLKL